MNKEEKIQQLTGALAAVLYNGNDNFRSFETITAEQAEKMINSEGFNMGITCQGNLWIGHSAYFGSRWVFADKSLAAIAK